ncbi:MAG: FUN14 domain-containing protein [Phycisphaerales bacterium]
MGDAGERKGARGEAGGARKGVLAASPGWIKALVLVSVLVMAGGAALGVAARVTGGERPASTGTSGELPAGASGLAAPSGASAPPADDGGDAWMGEWSPVVFRLGFSFFVGFAVAYALRTFVKLSLVVIGLFALFLFGLEYAGLLEIHWGAIGDKYESVASWASGQFDSFRTFITGELPSAAAAVAGLALGFKRG